MIILSGSCGDAALQRSQRRKLNLAGYKIVFSTAIRPTSRGREALALGQGKNAELKLEHSVHGEISLCVVGRRRPIRPHFGSHGPLRMGFDVAAQCRRVVGQAATRR